MKEPDIFTFKGTAEQFADAQIEYLTWLRQQSNACKEPLLGVPLNELEKDLNRQSLLTKRGIYGKRMETCPADRN